MYSDMSMRTIASSSPNRNSASVRASSVLPTPDGPRKMNEPVGRFGSLRPARERRIAFETASIAGWHPLARLWRSAARRGLLADDAPVHPVLHPHQLLGLGLGELEDGDAGPHRDDVGDLLLGDGGALALALAGFPGLLERALLVRQAPLRVAEVGGLLELLRLDGSFLGAAGLLDLVLELAVDGRRGHRLDAHARRGLVDEVDGLVGQEAVGDVAVGQLGGGLEGLVGDLDLVVLLVTVAQALEDLNGLLGGRLVDADLLEAALQRAVALEVLAVLVECGGADRLQLAAGQRRLENRGGVDRPLGSAGAD